MSALVAGSVAPTSVTILDVVFIAVVAYSSLRGFSQGVISEMGLLLALIVGTYLASQFAAQAGAPLERFGVDARLRAVFGYILVLAIVWIATRLATGVLRGGAKVLMLGWVDHLWGTVFGFLRGLLVVVVAGFLIVHFHVGALSTVAHESVLIHAVAPLFPALNNLLPPHLQLGPTLA